MRNHILISCFIFGFAACTTDAKERTETNATAPTKTTPPTTHGTSKLKTTSPKTQPEELGDIHWSRDFHAAKAQSKAQNKPMFVLFTEVPGCSTVKGFANTVLTHPQIVEAIESQFIPVVVYNNIKGPDRKILNTFKEPTWNNPVVRIMDAESTMLSKRYAGPYNINALSQTMLKGLSAAKQPAPTYLQLLNKAHAAKSNGTKTAVFPMYCFWSGETKLGNLNGVVASRTGFAGGHEVVEVHYDAKTTSRQQLAAFFGKSALKEGIKVKPSKKDDKYQLKHSLLRHVPMTSIQASQVNAALGHGKSPYTLLSSAQVGLYQTIKKHPKAKWPEVLMAADFKAAWDKTNAFAKTLR